MDSPAGWNPKKWFLRIVRSVSLELSASLQLRLHHRLHMKNGSFLKSAKEFAVSLYLTMLLILIYLSWYETQPHSWAGAAWAPVNQQQPEMGRCSTPLAALRSTGLCQSLDDAVMLTSITLQSFWSNLSSHPHSWCHDHSNFWNSAAELETRTGGVLIKLHRDAWWANTWVINEVFGFAETWLLMSCDANKYYLAFIQVKSVHPHFWGHD